VRPRRHNVYGERTWLPEIYLLATRRPKKKKTNSVNEEGVTVTVGACDSVTVSNIDHDYLVSH
jgi:hypothetical protein